MNPVRLVAQSLTSTARVGEGKIDVHYPYGTTLAALLPVVIFGLLVTHFDVLFVALMAGAVAAFAAATYWLNRLTADANGVCISNYGARERIGWDQIADFEVGTRRALLLTGPWRHVIIRLKDGETRKPMATRGGSTQFASETGYSTDRLEQIVERLRSLQRKNLGVQDSPELTAAFRAASEGNPEPLDHLLASAQITPAEYTFRLHEMALAGDVDMDLLRTRRRNDI